MNPLTLALTPVETHEKLIACKDASPAERRRLEDEVVRAHLPLARRLARRYARTSIDVDDLTQVANLALIKAMRGFNPEAGAFEPYAHATIHGELKRYLRDFGWSIKPPRRVQELYLQVAQATEQLAQDNGDIPGAAALAERMQADVTDVGEAMSAHSCFSPSSLDSPTGLTGRPLGEMLADSSSDFDRVDDRVSLAQICDGLPDEDAALLRMSYLEGKSQREIAEMMGISQMQVSRRLAKLLRGLRTKALQLEAA